MRLVHKYLAISGKCIWKYGMLAHANMFTKSFIKSNESVDTLFIWLLRLSFPLLSVDGRISNVIMIMVYEELLRGH